MIFLYFLLDLTFYNYTAWKTHFFLLTFLEKKKNDKITFFLVLLIDYLLTYKGKFFLSFFFLFLINRQIKISYENWTSNYSRFFLLFVLYQVFTYLLYHKITIDPVGFLLTLIFVGFGYKKAFCS